MNRAERRQQAKNDERTLARGIDSVSEGVEHLAAMARQMDVRFERARREHNIDPAVKFLHAKVEATLEAGKGVAVACRQGCSHCCHSWVSAPAPEILFIAKRIRAGAGAVERVRAAHALTGGLDVEERQRGSHACPLLDRDLCSIYEMRPMACRFAASANAEICARVFLNASGESIPSPVRNLRGRGAYQMALGLALRHAGLPHVYYEFNAGLARALERDDAERAWLNGEDVFANVRRDPTDVLTHPQAAVLYRQTFGD